MLADALQTQEECMSEGSHTYDAERISLFSRYQLLVSSVLMASLPRHFPGMYVSSGWVWHSAVSYFCFKF